MHQRHGTTSRPVRELEGFRRVIVTAGATTTVRLPLGAERPRCWGARVRGFVRDATTLDVWVGGSSRADLTVTLEVVG